MSKDKYEKRGVYLYIDDHEIKNNVSSVQAELRRIQREQEKMTIGSREYIEATKKIQSLKSILAEHRKKLAEVNAETKKGKDFVDKFNDGWSKFGNIITMGTAALAAFSLAIKSFNDAKNELEDSQAQLKALTGLDEKNIKWLTDQADKLSTTMEKSGLRIRQSTSEILQAYMLVGSNKPELLSDAEALNKVTIEVMRLASASGMKLEGAVTAVTTAMNQFGAASDDAAKYVNILAAGSKMGAADVQMQADAILKTGVAAKTAGLSIEDLDGAIEMLAEKGIKGSVAGTYLNSFLMKLATGSRAAKLQSEGLVAVLQDINAEYLAAEKSSAGSGLAKMTKEFSERGIRAAMVLSQNITKLKEYTAAVTDTNIATEQAAINSDTASAKLDQKKNKLKQIAIELADRLTPALRVATNSSIYILRLLPPFIDFLTKYGTTIMWVAGYIMVLRSRMLILGAATTAYNAVVKAGTVLQLAWNVAMNSAAGFTLTSFTQLKKLTALMAGHNVMLNTLRASTFLFGAALNVLNLRFDLAGKQLAGFGASIVKLVKIGNPFTWIVTGVTALIGAVTWLHNAYDGTAAAIKRHNDRLKEADELTKKEQERVEELSNTIHDSNKSYTERMNALNDLKKIVPDYHASLTKEGQLINDNTDALTKYNRVQAISNRLKALYASSNELTELRGKLRGSNGTLQSYNTGSTFGYKQATRIDNTKQLEQLDKEIDIIQKEIIQLQNEKTEIISNKNNPAPAATEPDGGGDPNTTPEKESEKQKKIRKAIADVDAKFLAMQEAIKKQYLDGDIKTQQEYNSRLEALEIQHLNEKLKIAGLEPKQREELLNKIQDIKIKVLERLKELNLEELDVEENSTKKAILANQKAWDNELSIVERAHSLQLIYEEEYLQKKELLRRKYEDKNKKILQSDADARITKEIAEYQQSLDEQERYYSRYQGDEETALRLKREALIAYYNELLQDESLSAEKRLEIEKMRDEEQEAAEDEHIAIMKEKNKKLYDMYSSLGKDLGEEIGAFLSDQEAALGDLLKSVGKMLLDKLQKVVTEAIAERTIDNIATLGLPGIAKAAREIALINAAFAAAKGILGNFWSGGFTGPGAWNQPKGTVHAGEFVANRFAVSNPDVRPVLDLIDVAQRTNTIGSLSADDILAVSGREPAAKVNSVSRNVQVSHSTDNTLLIRLAKTVDKLSKQLDSPIEAYTSISGRSGSAKQNELYKKMINNKSR